MNFLINCFHSIPVMNWCTANLIYRLWMLSLSWGASCSLNRLHLLPKRWYITRERRVNTDQALLCSVYAPLYSCNTSAFSNLETLVPKEPPIVQEITSVLREWGPLLRNLFVVSGFPDLSATWLYYITVQLLWLILDLDVWKSFCSVWVHFWLRPKHSLYF